MSVDLLVKSLVAVTPADVGGAIPRALHLQMCWRADDDGTIRKPIVTLAAEVGVNRDTARLAMRELEARGWLDPIGKTSGGRQPTLYRVIVNPRVARGLAQSSTRADYADLPAGRARVNPRGGRDEKNRKNRKKARQVLRGNLRSTRGVLRREQSQPASVAAAERADDLSIDDERSRLGSPTGKTRCRQTARQSASSTSLKDVVADLAAGRESR